MKTRTSHGAAYMVAATICLLCGPVASAAEVSGSTAGISLSSLTSNFESVRITGPNGFAAVTYGGFVTSPDGSPLSDGVYRYELVGTQCHGVSSQEMSRAMRDNASNGREPDARPSSCREVVVDSGSFRIEHGVVVPSDLIEE